MSHGCVTCLFAERILFDSRNTKFVANSSSRLFMRGSTRLIARPFPVPKCCKGAVTPSCDFTVIYWNMSLRRNESDTWQWSSQSWIREYDPNSFCIFALGKQNCPLDIFDLCPYTSSVKCSSVCRARFCRDWTSPRHVSRIYQERLPMLNMISSVLYIPGPQVFQHLLLLLMFLVIPNRQISEKPRSLSRLTLDWYKGYQENSKLHNIWYKGFMKISLSLSPGPTQIKPWPSNQKVLQIYELGITIMLQGLDLKTTFWLFFGGNGVYLRRKEPFCGDGLSGSLLNQLLRHYGAIFRLNEILARFGRKKAEINKKPRG